MDNLSDNELSIQARNYVRSNSKKIINELASLEKYPSVNTPETILMAGAPGAGKTEYSEQLLALYYANNPDAAHYVLIDPDALRDRFEGYTGTNAAVFNSAVSLAVEKTLDHVIAKNQNVIIDGTLSHYGPAEKNIKRALGHNRNVGILYVHQDPQLAWEFVQKREALLKRKVSRSAFIEACVSSRENALKLKQNYGKRITLNIVIKDHMNQLKRLEINVDNIDSYVGKLYSMKELGELLHDI